VVIFGIFCVGTERGHGGIYEPATMMSVPGAPLVALAQLEADWQCYQEEGAASAYLNVRLGGVDQHEPVGSNNQ
jgi:hypothetical protein